MFKNDDKIYKYPLHDVVEIKNLREMVDYSASTFKDKTAYLIKDPIALREVDYKSPEAQNIKSNPDQDYRSISFERFAQDRLALGSGLKNLGNIKQNDKIVILAETRYEWYVTYLATVCGLAVISPMDKELPSNELANLLQRSRGNTLCFSKEQVKKLLEIKDKLNFIENFICYDLLPDSTINEIKNINENASYNYFWALLDKGQELRDAGDISYDNLPIDNEALAILLFTSGTTSRSKAVMLSHRNITTDMMDIAKMVYFDENDTILSILPLHHTYEANAGFLMEHYKGATIAVNDGLRHLSKNMTQAGSTIIVAVPLILEKVHHMIFKTLNADEELRKKFNFGLKLSKTLRKIGIDIRKKIFKQVHDKFGGKVRLVISGGAAVDPQILRDLDDLGFNTIQGYGLTESSPIMACNRPKYSNPAAIGLPLPRAEVKIINKDSNGIGELICRAPYIMIGYYEDEEKTAEAIDAEGFYHTGDYGYQDEKGFLFITGRKANIIVTKNGKNIFPEEIESIMLQEEIINEIVIFGEADNKGEQIITAEVFPDEEYLSAHPELSNEALNSDKVLAAVEEAINKANLTINPYKRVKNVILRDTPFPRNTSKKILRNRDQVNVK